MRLGGLLWASGLITAARGAATPKHPFIDPEHLPDHTLFPGPWEQYIKAPANKTHITPRGIWAVEGNVTTSSHGGPLSVGDHVPGEGILIGTGGLVTFVFDENIAGR